MTDAELLRADADAFAAFYRRYEPTLLGFMVRTVGRADLAADLVAESFARAIEGRDRFDPQLGEAGAWLFGIARNVLMSSFERDRVEDG